MDTALSPKESDSRQVLVERADKELAHAYEQITRADKQIAHAEKQLSKMERAAAAGKRSLFDRPAVRGLTGLAVGGVHRCRRHGLAVILPRHGQRGYREVVAAARRQYVAARKPGAARAAEPI